MIRRFVTQATDDLPAVILDAKNNIFKISGRILPEDGSKFFQPIYNWLERYIKEPNDLTEFHLKLDYYNSSTARLLTKMIVELEKIKDTGKKVIVVWEYYEDDEVMEERGAELKSISFLPFMLKKIKH